MNDKNIARKIVLGYLNSTVSLEHVEHIAEIALVNTDDEVLLEHINHMLGVLERAKKEIEKERK